MVDEPTCTSETCKIQRMTRSSMYTSPIVFVRSKRESSDQQGAFVHCTSNEKLLVVSTLERVYSIDISHDGRGHADLTVVQFRNGFDGKSRFKEILRHPTLDPINVNNIPVLIVQTFEPTSGDGEVRSPVSPRVKEVPRTSKTSPSLVSRVSTRSCVGVAGSEEHVYARCIFHGYSTARLSPMNLSRPSSFATEANPGSSGEDGNLQASLQRDILRTQARHCGWVTAKNEESSPSASGSSSAPYTCGSQSSNGTIAARVEN